jgi:hypothetical protein
MPATTPTPLLATTSTTTNGQDDAPPSTATTFTAPSVSSPQVPPETTSATASEIVEQDPNTAMEEERYDPQSVIEDIREDLADGRHSFRFQQYISEKPELIGKDVPTGKGNKPADQEFKNNGICNFDFNNTTEPSPSRDPRGRRINFLSLLIHLWPGKWQEQLKQLNGRIRLENEEGRRSTRNG